MDKTKERVYYSDETCLTCLFTSMRAVEAVDGMLRVMGTLRFSPIYDGSVEFVKTVETGKTPETHKFDVNCENGNFVAYIEGKLWRDSHTIKYKYKSTHYPDEENDAYEND